MVIAGRRGDVEFWISAFGQRIKCYFKDVLYVLDLQYALDAVSALSKDDMRAKVCSSGVSVTKEVKRRASGKLF